MHDVILIANLSCTVNPNLCTLIVNPPQALEKNMKKALEIKQKVDRLSHIVSRALHSASSQQASAVVNYNSSEVDGVMW